MPELEGHIRGMLHQPQLDTHWRHLLIKRFKHMAFANTL